MPTFETPKPITATIQIEAGSAKITSGDRADTVVEVYPTSAGSEADVQAAEQTRVGYTDGKLLVKTPKGKVKGAPGSVRVEIALPRGSQLNGTAARCDFVSEGPVGACSLTTSEGDIRIDQAGAVQLRTQNGDITVDRAGDAEITTGNGELRIGAIDGTAAIKNAGGNTQVESVTGPVQLKVAEGNIAIGRALAEVTSTSAIGDVSIEEAHGRVDLRTQTGNIQVGIPEGTAAWLDANAQAGTVHRLLDSAEGTGEVGATVDVYVRTYSGDIVVHRAHSSRLVKNSK
ncbi:hypothetical protein SLUN_38480 (plasmid) [Streptomyces lunaelactis]|uniref:DUF4097 domain-containing protein n=1 Tax=Streptomyces lunaelactis TaxID=1535768 RepID=A0A2R4TFN8_9ACTN|nr:DUF4097 family beta strand repeat-containing protein [Streptomyces lunaelactis]AVZ77924.1 hypothetical protein SLUN_38480 [Streptomyces lunaelactis]NUK83415.1 DUF4097 family beta strand repeat protein [Streptomyces lunaelactis]NUL01700.1 DUF4097 family beta strand repeat protein [Streptomyces lunaelactis]